MSDRSPRRGRGRPRAFDGLKSRRARELLLRGVPVNLILEHLGISRATFYRYREAWRVPELTVGVLDYFKASVGYYERFPDGPHPGHQELQVMKLLATELGMKVRFKPAEFSTLFEGVESGAFDLAIGFVGASEGRQRMYAVSEPYFNPLGLPTGALVARKSLRISTADPPSLAGKRVGALSMSLNHEWLLAAAIPNLEIVPSGRPDSYFKALQAGQLDAILDASVSAAFFVAVNRDFEIKPPLVDYGDAKTCMLLHRENGQLLERVSGAIHRLRREHRIAPFEEKLFLKR